MLTELDKAQDAAIAAITAPGGQLEVAEAKIRGIPLKIFKSAPPTMREFFRYFFHHHAQREFLVYGDERLTFADVYAKAMRIAAAVQQSYGIAKGDRVAIAMRNYPEWAMTYIALTHIGAVVVPMNAWWQPEEIAYGLSDSGARLVIADEERLRRVAAIPGCAVPVAAVRTDRGVAAELGADLLNDLIDAGPGKPGYLPPLAREDDVSIFYTSGSTGYPKGAVSTHRAVVHGTFSFMLQGLAMLKLAEAAGTPVPAQQIVLLNVPLFHVTGLVPLMLVSVTIGRKLILMHRWDAGEALRLIDKEKCTYFVGVPTMTHEIMAHPDRDKYDISSVTDWAAGGAPRPPEHVDRLAKTIPTGKPAIGYGLTETNGVGAAILRESYLARPASTGRATKPLVELAILDDTGAPLPPHAAGEVCIRSAANVRGYWRRPAETAEAFDAEGWFHSGDVGYLDEDGFLFIVDRKKDIIIRGGENVSCQEVEAAIYAHPAVMAASVFGLPDDRLGEIVGAVVYLKPGETTEPGAIVDFTRQHLAAFKLPTKLWISPDPLPRLGSEKIDKVMLRTLYREIHTRTG